MPSLGFYATGADYRLVCQFIFAQPGWVLYEMTSRDAAPPRAFTSERDLFDAFDFAARAQHFVLWCPALKARLRHPRIDITSGPRAPTCRYETVGWGALQLATGALTEDELAHAQLSHNTRARAERWQPTYPELGAVSAWDWTALTRISRQLNRHIASLAASKVGARPVLPAAHAAAGRGVALT